LHAYHFQFTINANIVNIPVDATFNMSMVVGVKFQLYATRVY